MPLQLCRYFIQLSLKDMRHAEAALSAWFATATLPPAYTTDITNSAAAEYASRIYIRATLLGCPRRHNHHAVVHH